MIKKIMCIVLAVMMLLSVCAISASAVDATASTGEGNVINFDVKSTGWQNFKKVFCHVYAHDGSGEWPSWQSKAESCTYDAATGIATYDLSKTKNVIEDGVLYVVIFSVDTGLQTYNLLFGAECIGDTAYCDGTAYENPEDSSKSALAAFWRGQDPIVYGPEKCVTSIGNVVGTCVPFTTSAQEMLVKFLVNTLENARLYSGKDDQQLLDDTAKALGLSQDNVEEAIFTAGVYVDWSASESSLPGGYDDKPDREPGVPDIDVPVDPIPEPEEKPYPEATVDDPEVLPGCSDNDATVDTDDNDAAVDSDKKPNAATTNQSASDNQKNTANSTAVKTGSTALALALLTVLAMAAGVVMFVRKRKFD